MRRDKGSTRFVIFIVTLCYYLVSQNGVEGNTLKNATSDGDNYKEEIISGEENKKLLKENEKKVDRTDDTENLSIDTSDLKTSDSDSDTTKTLYERVQEMPLKLGLQFLGAKYAISESLDKARRGGTNIYDGTMDAIKAMTEFVGEGIGNAKFLLFGTK